MNFKMENPNKVKNIVIGSFDGLNSLYGKDSQRLKLLESQGIVSLDKDKDGDLKIMVRELLNKSYSSTILTKIYNTYSIAFPVQLKRI
jgi:hypothetical protein